jgi:DNA polymerase III sliding clamp (beta) subunit (PCNA family)
MRINKVDLQNALERVKPGLANKELIQQATSFAFLNGCVATYNDEIALTHPVPNLEITGAVQATELYQLLKKLKQDELELTVTENEIQLTSGKTKAGLTLQTEIKLPLSEVERKSKWKTLPENFKDALRFAVSSCSKDMSKPVLTCVHVNAEGFIEGCDNYRVARWTLEAEFPTGTFLIPQSSVLELLKLDPVKVALDGGWVHFITEDKTTMSCRIIDDKFPDTTRLLNVKGVELSFPEGITEILDRASVFAKRDTMLDETVLISVEKDKVQVESKSETGWFKEVVDVDYNGDALHFDITPNLLKGILQETPVFSHCGKTLKFESGSWVYVVSLRGGGK